MPNASDQTQSISARSPQATERNWNGATRGVLPFILLTFALSWSVWIAGWLALGRPAKLETFLLVIAIGSAGPTLAAILLTLISKDSFGDLLRPLVRLRAGWRAYALALLVLPITAVLVTLALGYKAPEGETAIGLVTLFPAAILNGIFAVLMGAGPLGEELGWRGYLLPRLLSRGQVVASVIVGVVWTLWHLPVVILFADWRVGIDVWVFLPIYGLGLIALSYVFTRLWIESGGSLFLCIWFHGIVNAVALFAFSDYWVSAHSQLDRVLALTLTFLATALIVWAVRDRRRGTHL